MELLQTELDGIRIWTIIIVYESNEMLIQDRVARTCCIAYLQHSHKKRKDSLETRAVFSWILILTWNFGGGRSASASTLASTSWFWCYQNYNWLFYMLHNDIISTSASEAVEKIPADEKDYRKCSFMCFTLHSHSS